MFVYRGGLSLAETTEDTMSDTRSPEDRVADLVGLLNVVTAELVGVIGEVIRAGAWEGFGIRSPEHWVVWRCGVSPGRARRLVRWRGHSMPCRRRAGCSRRVSWARIKRR
jgi:hypothetical protein